jgi:hypothetical protein
VACKDQGISFILLHHHQHSLPLPTRLLKPSVYTIQITRRLLTLWNRLLGLFWGWDRQLLEPELPEPELPESELMELQEQVLFRAIVGVILRAIIRAVVGPSERRRYRHRHRRRRRHRGCVGLRRPGRVDSGSSVESATGDECDGVENRGKIALFRRPHEPETESRPRFLLFKDVTVVIRRFLSTRLSRPLPFIHPLDANVHGYVLRWCPLVDF